MSTGDTVERPFVRVTWQRGLPDEVGLNGCRIEDVLAVAADKLKVYQEGPLACEENDDALRSIADAVEAMEARHRRRVEQGVLNTMKAHESERTEDTDADFSATGA